MQTYPYLFTHVHTEIFSFRDLFQGFGACPRRVCAVTIAGQASRRRAGN
jgi:hypothetical protein